MTEPKWTLISEITDASLGWFARDEQNQRCFEMTRPKEQTNVMKTRCEMIGATRLWGPMLVPDPPKELPTGRRFKAVHRNLGQVSGVYVKERSPVLMAYHVFYWERELLRDCWTELEYFCGPIQWLDKE